MRAASRSIAAAFESTPQPRSLPPSESSPQAWSAFRCQSTFATCIPCRLRQTIATSACWLNADDLNLPDGMPLVWIAWRLGMRWLTKRVYGPDLMAEVLDRGRCLGLRHYMYGSTPEVLEALQHELESRYPGLDIVGVEAPPFRALTDAEVRCNIERMRTSGADVVWTGLGTPKQDEFVHSFHQQIGRPTVAVGAAFDFFAGTTKQAPPWMQSSGLEWLFRLTHEPRRLWRRYLIGNTKFLRGLVVEGTPIAWRVGKLDCAERPRVRETALLARFNVREAVFSFRSLFRSSEDAVKALIVDAKRSDRGADHELVARRHSRGKFSGIVMHRTEECDH